MAFPTDPTPHQLTVVLNGVGEGGYVRVAVYAESTDFSDSSSAIATANLEARLGSVTAVFPDLPPGTYAVAAFHDKDGSGEVSTNFLGMPTERYGFSNDARGVLGPPNYEDCAFRVDGETEVRIELR